KTCCRTETQTCYRDVCHTTCRPVCESKVIEVECGEWKTVQECIPGPVMTRCVQDPGTWEWDPCTCCCCYRPGCCREEQVQCPSTICCKKVWCPRTEQRTITCTRYVQEVHHCQVPYTV